MVCSATLLLVLLLRRPAPAASFGLAWLVIAFLPVSNLLIPVGFITAERTLFLPSVGLLIAAGSAAQYLARRQRVPQRRFAAAALGVLLSLGLWRSVDRMRVWNNNDTFFRALLHDASNGYRTHYLYGIEPVRRARRRVPEGDRDFSL